MAALLVDILTPDREFFSGEATAVTLPGTEGSFQILNMHAPLISTLGKGMIKVATANGELKFQAQDGVVEVLKNKVIILVEKIAEA